MDVALLGASVAVSLRERNSIQRVTLFLSLTTVSISFLETCPSSMLLFLSRGHLTVAYRVALTMLCLTILFVIPSIVGARFLSGMKYEHWSIRILSQIIKGIFSLVSRIRKRKDKNVLAMTTNDLQMESRRRRFSIDYCSSSFLGGLGGVILMLVLGNAIGPLVIRTSDDAPTLSRLVSWLCAFGIILSALMNGFGSVSLPHSCLQGLYLEPVSANSVLQAEKELKHAQESLHTRQEELNTIGLGGHSENKWGKSFSNAGDDTVQRRKLLQNETDFIQSLIVELQNDIEEMKHAQELALSARTVAGRVRSVVGAVFSIILLIRLFSASLFLYTHSFSERHRPGGDPITMILAWLTGQKFVSQYDYNMLAQLISLSLTAILSISQTRTMFRTLETCKSYIQKFWCGHASRHRKPVNSDALYPIALSSLVGCYFLACIVMTKMMMPEKYRESFTEALGGDEAFVVRSYAVNATFCLSAVVSSAILGILLGIKRQNTRRYTSSTSFEA